MRIETRILIDEEWAENLGLGSCQSLENGIHSLGLQNDLGAVTLGFISELCAKTIDVNILQLDVRILHPCNRKSTSL